MIQSQQMLQSRLSLKLIPRHREAVSVSNYIRTPQNSSRSLYCALPATSATIFTLASPTFKNTHLLESISQRTSQISQHLGFSSTVGSPSSSAMTVGKQTGEFSVRKVGAPNTLDFRAYLEKDGTPVSPFHDIPLYANEQQNVLNMIVEIPRWTNAKLEVQNIPCLTGHHPSQLISRCRRFPRRIF